LSLAGVTSPEVGAALALRANAKPPGAKLGDCAKWVSEALCAAGLPVCDGGPHAIKYGPFLTKPGFVQVGAGKGMDYPFNYTPQMGDIIWFWYEPNGHVAGYDGTNWNSDWVQNSHQPNIANSADRHYVIFRRP
jgi:hypothetical protein